VTVVLFCIFAGAALAGALGVVLSRNPVHSALWLVLTLVSVAVFFLLEDAQLVAAVQIIVYASAIVVLFLFVIMLLGIDRHESLKEQVPFQRPVALAVGAIVLAEVLYLAGHTWATGAKVGGDRAIHGTVSDGRGHQVNLTNIQRVARLLFTDFLWPFQITAALLVIAVVGSVVLARRSGQAAEPPIDAPEGADAPAGETIP